MRVLYLLNRSMILIFIISASFEIQAQKVDLDKLNSWIKGVEKEFLGFDFTNARQNNDYLIKVYNLYSDRFFVPVFQKKFDEMSESERHNIWKKFKSWQTPRNFNKTQFYNNYVWIFMPFNPNGTGKYTYDKIVNGVVDLRRTRQKNEEDLQQIQKNQKTYTEVFYLNNQFKYQSDNKISPGELERYKKVTDDWLAQNASQELKNMLQEVEKMPKGYNYLNSLENFKIMANNQGILKHVSPGEISALDKELEIKKSEIIKVLIDAENRLLERIGTDENSYGDYINWYTRINANYEKFRSRPDVEAMYKQYQSIRLNQIMVNEEKFYRELDSAYVEPQLDWIYKKHLFCISGEDSRFSKWTTAINNKRQTLRDEAESKRKQEQEEQHLARMKRHQELKEQWFGQLCNCCANKPIRCSECSGQGVVFEWVPLLGRMDYVDCGKFGCISGVDTCDCCHKDYFIHSIYGD